MQEAPPLPDPGSWDMMGREAKGVLAYPAMFFEGLKATYNRGVGPNMQVEHSMSLGGGQENSYKFAPTYVGTHANPGSPQVSGAAMFPMRYPRGMPAVLAISAL